MSLIESARFTLAVSHAKIKRVAFRQLGMRSNRSARRAATLACPCRAKSNGGN